MAQFSGVNNFFFSVLKLFASVLAAESQDEKDNKFGLNFASSFRIHKVEKVNIN